MYYILRIILFDYYTKKLVYVSFVNVLRNNLLNTVQSLLPESRKNRLRSDFKHKTY